MSYPYQYGYNTTGNYQQYYAAQQPAAQPAPMGYNYQTGSYSNLTTGYPSYPTTSYPNATASTGYGNYQYPTAQYPTYSGTYTPPAVPGYTSYPTQPAYPTPFVPVIPTPTVATQEAAPSPSELNVTPTTEQTAAAPTSTPTTAATSATPTTEQSAAAPIPTTNSVAREEIVLPTAPSHQPVGSSSGSNAVSVTTGVWESASVGTHSTGASTKVASSQPLAPWASHCQGMYNQWVLPKKALIIACSYPDNKLGAELQNIEPYAVKIYYLLLHTFHIPQEAITVLCDCDGTNNTNTRPTKNNIKQAIQWLTWQTKPGDSLFLYYIGHGGIQPHLNIDTEGIVPTDWEVSGYLPGRELQQLLVSTLPTGSRMMILMDCLNSGIHLPKVLDANTIASERALGSALFNFVLRKKGKKDKKDKKDKKGSKKGGVQSIGLMSSGVGGGPDGTGGSVAVLRPLQVGFISMYSYAANILSVGSEQKHGHFTNAFVSAVGSSASAFASNYSSASSSSSAGGSSRSYVQVFADTADHLSSISTENPIVPELSTNGDHEIHEPLVL